MGMAGWAVGAQLTKATSLRLSEYRCNDEYNLRRVAGGAGGASAVIVLPPPPPLTALDYENSNWP